ncbi:MAG TPA: diaminopimelate decarboxylase [Nevskiales bacterium]|nr:diaminopimelate decarboxylase [Nevskiales bacterium]
MDVFEYRDGRLFAEGADLARLAAEYGTPCYVYSRAAITDNYLAYDRALAGVPHRICYAVKANSNLGVLSVLARLGAGFDIVSGGELARVLRAGGDPRKVVFSGVGKREDEMAAALAAGIACFNVESESELRRLSAVAVRLGKTAAVSLRVNPDVDAQTHPYIATGLRDNKFGIDIARAEAAYREAARLPGLEIVGVDCHIGSQLTQLDPYVDALKRLLELIDRLQAAGIRLRHLDLGGGLGIRYREERPPRPEDYAEAVLPQLKGRALELWLEPGRSIVGNAGVLLTRVEYLKHAPHKNFAIVDAAMNDLMRPALYNAWQEILPVVPRADEPAQVYDVVGPVCETGDWLGRERELAVREGDLLAIRSAGAYGFVMSSNYNSRPRAAEVLVDGDRAHLVRARETRDDLWRGESLVPSPSTGEG